MARRETPKETDGWDANHFTPKPGKCKQCGKSIPRTRKRGSAFGGWGRPREFCDAKCRKRWSRAHGKR
jgi:hypothetical protein